MHNMKIRKLAGVLAAAMALTAMPLSANATAKAKDVNAVNPGTTAEEKALKAEDPTSRKGLSPVKVNATGEALNVTGDVIDGGSVDTNIAVWGFTEDKTVYSVDVEWGAMTFQYEKSSWDPKTHTKLNVGDTGYTGGWAIYDDAAETETEKRLTDTQHKINRITITNHSNAGVAANLSYEGVTKSAIDNKDYSDIKGKFTDNENTDKDPVPDRGGADSKPVEVTPGEGTCDIKLPTAEGTAFAEAPRASVYFMPESDTAPAADTIEKWTKIGVITVKLQTVPDVP